MIRGVSVTKVNQAACHLQSVGTCSGGGVCEYYLGPHHCTENNDGAGNACVWTSTNLCTYESTESAATEEDVEADKESKGDALEAIDDTIEAEKEVLRTGVKGHVTRIAAFITKYTGNCDLKIDTDDDDNNACTSGVLNNDENGCVVADTQQVVEGAFVPAKGYTLAMSEGATTLQPIWACSKDCFTRTFTVSSFAT